MKVSQEDKYNCSKCKSKSFSYSDFWSKWASEFGAYHNVAIGKCEKCGWHGEFSTVNKAKFYEAHV